MIGGITSSMLKQDKLGIAPKTFLVYGTMSVMAVPNSIPERERFIRSVEILIDMPNVPLGSLSPDERQCFFAANFMI